MHEYGSGEEWGRRGGWAEILNKMPMVVVLVYWEGSG